MTNQAFRSAPPRPLHPSTHEPAGATWGEVADLIRRFCADGGRHGFRLCGRERSGHLFIDQGQVVHAEYGEDFGLSAILKLLRAGPMSLERWHGSWPRHGSIHLSPERLLARPSSEEAHPPVETRVVRKVTLPEAARPREPSRRAVRLRASFKASRAAQSADPPPTTMVRLSTRGVVFAAHGQHATRLAEAAALIHGLSQLVARDLSQPSPTAVHLRGGQNSVLVMRSEVNDVAAAYGPTPRLAALLGKAGVR